MNDIYIRWDSGSALIKSNKFFPLKQRDLKVFEWMIEMNYFTFPEDNMLTAVYMLLTEEALKEEHKPRKKRLESNIAALTKWAAERFDYEPPEN